MECGKNEREQVEHIFKIFGTPSYEEWPSKDWKRTFRLYPAQNLSNLGDAEGLIKALMTLNPKKRIAIPEALKHSFIKTDMNFSKIIHKFSQNRIY